MMVPGRSAVAAHREKLQLAAKVGWGTKGALYLTLGILALMAGFGSGGQISGSEGVLQWIQNQPLGSVLLVIAALGFSCYAIWRFVQAALDPEAHDSD